MVAADPKNQRVNNYGGRNNQEKKRYKIKKTLKITERARSIMSVEKIHLITGKSKKVILSDLSILSRKINRADRVLSETLLYSSEKVYNYYLLSEIFYTELCYCRRAIDFIQLICQRYAEEENETTHEYDYVETLPLTKKDLNPPSGLSAQLLAGSELLNKRMHQFLQRLGLPIMNWWGWDAIVHRFQKSIESLETTCPSATHGQLRDDFQELSSISSNVWNVMSLLASFNLFRLTAGSIYEMEPC